MHSVADNIKTLREAIPGSVRLVAVSKFQSTESIRQAYACGQRLFGENYVQELIEKRELLPMDIEWHFIGHLQSNKVKQIAPFIHCIHGVDSFKLLHAIQEAAKKNNRKISCLLQVHVAQEETKHGLSKEELIELIALVQSTDLSHVTISGVMGMASFTNDLEQIRKEMRMIKELFDLAKKDFFRERAEFSEISMGMSSDWSIAIEEGSTLVRIGSAIFGDRNK